MISLTVNGTPRTFDGDASMPLLWFLRDDLELDGTKYGCGVGSCGACTIHLDGRAVRACQTKMSVVQGRSVTTIEGLHPSGAPLGIGPFRRRKVDKAHIPKSDSVISGRPCLVDLPPALFQFAGAVQANTKIESNHLRKRIFSRNGICGRNALLTRKSSQNCRKNDICSEKIH